jgi:hypothetical protein
MAKNSAKKIGATSANSTAADPRLSRPNRRTPRLASAAGLSNDDGDIGESLNRQEISTAKL